jgi:predicted metal-dependent hydrolase
MKTLGKVQQFEYVLTYRRKTRRIVLHIDAEGKISIVAPYYVSRREIERFIMDNQEKVGNLQAQHPQRSWCDGESLAVQGAMVAIRLSSAARNVSLQDSSTLLVPEGSRDEVRCHVREYFRRETRRRVVPLVEMWKRRLGLSVGVISIRDSHRVWASCSRSGNLNFSLRCEGLGDDDLSYLVLHELAHRVHFDHSPGFHAYLDAHMSDWRVYERHLRIMQPLCDVFGG